MSQPEGSAPMPGPARTPSREPSAVPNPAAPADSAAAADQAADADLSASPDAVTRALAALGDLDSSPVHEHAERFQAVHASLQAALSDTELGEQSP